MSNTNVQNKEGYDAIGCGMEDYKESWYEKLIIKIIDFFKRAK